MQHDFTRTDLKIQCFLDFTRGLSHLSTCRRLKVGCIICDKNFTRVYSIGYNGQPSKTPHGMCTEVAGSCGCVHAEANAISKLRTEKSGLVLITTHSPCSHCAGLIANCEEVQTVMYCEEYRTGSVKTKDTLDRAGKQLILLDSEKFV